MTSEGKPEYLTADYEQVELRVLAQMAHPRMVPNSDPPAIACQYVRSAGPGWTEQNWEEIPRSRAWTPVKIRCLQPAKWMIQNEEDETDSEGKRYDPIIGGSEARYACNAHLATMLEYDANRVVRLDQ